VQRLLRAKRPNDAGGLLPRGRIVQTQRVGVSAVLAKLRWSAGVVSNPAAPTLVELGNVLFRGAMTFYTTTGVLPRS
jgi:hypothetical protein